MKNSSVITKSDKLSEEQICGLFRGCKKPSEQIDILMDLTLLDRTSITEILIRNGYNTRTGKKM